MSRSRATLLLLVAQFSALTEESVARAETPQSSFELVVADSKASMMSEPTIALTKAKEAANMARSLPSRQSVIAMATAQWLEGEALTRLAHIDQAAPVIVAALKSVKRAAPNTKLHADLLKSRAAIASQTGEIPQALELLHNAHNIYERLGEARSRAIVLQNIGSIYSDARDHPRTLRYYEQAREVFADDPALNLSSHNNRGNAFKGHGPVYRCRA